jgi:nitrous oxidase accessory protein
MHRPVHTLLLLAAACVDATPPPVAPRALPIGGVAIAPGDPLQPRIDAAVDGDVLTLLPGVHRGPVRIEGAVTLQGPVEAVIDGNGLGTVVDLCGDGSKITGFTIRNSGPRLDLQDSAVRVSGCDIEVAEITIERSLFGVLVHQSKRVVVRDNVILGTGDEAMGMRGDGIRLWETDDSTVRGNVVRDHRDVVVWYSSRNRVISNTIERCRYGTHFMFSHDNICEDNAFVDDVVGVFVMYSHDLLMRRNLLARAAGSAGIGLGVKESGNLRVEDNWFVQDTIGVYLDTSPLDPAHRDWFHHNVFRLCDTAVLLHAKSNRNEFRANLFADNSALIGVGGDGDALGCDFRGNYYDTYQGYDLNDDGVGDVPFEHRRLSSQLEGRYPDLALLHGAPAMHAVDLMGHLLPLFAPRLLLRDEQPLLYEPEPRFVPRPLHQEPDHAR